MQNDLLILDGGMGRQLEKMGAPFRQPEWSALALLEAPEYVSKVHDEFIAAGVDIITTNAYALIPFHIGEETFREKGYELIELAGKLARQSAESADHQVKVAGCLPPVFGSYRPDFFDATLAGEILNPLIEAQEAYIDFWLAETVSLLEEAEIIADALSKSSKPFWLFTLMDREGASVEPQLRSGVKLQEALNCAQDLNVDALLFNCSQVEEMLPAIEMISGMDIKVPYGAYANAFPPISKKRLANRQVHELREEITPEKYASEASQWISAGASIVGGCCGIGPKHILELFKLKNNS